MTPIRSSKLSPSVELLRSFRPRPTETSSGSATSHSIVMVERFFNLLKHFRAIATRYDKLARNFLAGVQLAAAICLLRLRTSGCAGRIVPALVLGGHGESAT